MREDRKKVRERRQRAGLCETASFVFLPVRNKTDERISSAAINGPSVWSARDLIREQINLHSHQHPISIQPGWFML